MSCFIPFQTRNLCIKLPVNFTNPFNYEPHALCQQAALILQSKLKLPCPTLKGRMYGVLVVINQQGQTGFLAAYSGNDQNHTSGICFVPQVFNITNNKGFFKQGEAELNLINHKIKHLKKADELDKLQSNLNTKQHQASEAIAAAKNKMAENKESRKIKRLALETSSDAEAIKAQLIKESQSEKSQFKKIKKNWLLQVEDAQKDLNNYLLEVQKLKDLRKIKSAQLQKQLFDHYCFLNQYGELKSATSIFESLSAKAPPAGTGDCAAPKLLQYAFANQFKPVDMAEFWWGTSPKNEIRRHGHFYPSCKSKCEPILGHMLKGFVFEHSNHKKPDVNITYLYEDESILVINKPEGLLSIPGKTESDSVYSRMQAQYPEATGPLVVHRLDMATSGILLIAKTKNAHAHLQKQFLNKTIKKRYQAILDGVIKDNEGIINLPLRVDINDRPRQLVCNEYGKSAVTHWKVIKRTEKQTLVYFYPITGRTHQLRVHAAHHMGLNTPIVGDALYGQKKDRLKLHAEQIEFIHPVTQKVMIFNCPPCF